MSSSPVTPWVLSDPSKGALLGLAHDLQTYLRDEPDVDVGDLGYTLAGERQQLGHRAVVSGRDPGDFQRALQAIELGSPAPNLIEGFAERPEEAVFVFPPHGPEWAGMGRELLETSDTFRRHIEACEEALEPFIEWSLVDVLREVDGAPGLERCDVAQPAILAVSIALAELLRSYGVEPVATLGHSIGDVPAAYMAGGLSLDDAARVMALWSQAQETLRDRGGMVSVQLPPAELLPYLEPRSAHLNVAGYNGPRVTVVTGDSEPLEELLEELHADGVRAHRVSVPLAAHSPHIDEIHERMLSDLAPIAPRSGRLPFYSSFAGDKLDTALLDAAYWPRALREVVEFERATRAVLEAGHRVLIEVSPHPVLTFGMRQTADAFGAGVILGSMRRGHAGPDRIAACLAEAWVHGVDVEWSAAFDESEQRRLDLPRSGAGDEPDERESLRERLLSASAGERDALAGEIVRNHVAAALGLPDVGDVPLGRSFKELGVESASAVELVERLSQLLEIRLPPTAAFDHPTSAALAERVLAEVLGVAPAVTRGRRPVSVALDEPIAIVGIGCRLPGGVGSAEDLWRLLDDGKDAIGSFPEDRGWDLDRLYDPDPDRPGTCYVRTGGFLYDAPEFDAEFFGISPREALGMDPQQRLLLQIAWEALEDAGIDPHSLRGSDTGVFAGMFPQEYGPRLHEANVTAGYSLTGNLISVASGRVAYSFGFEGPALTIDTACSSSLVAVHHACAALRQGECSLALAGGVTVLSTPGLLVEFSHQRGLAPDGRCKAFGAAADGTGFAEGAGLLVLERLSEARRQGHHVLAVVRGSAVNQDGASNGLTAPNGPSQELVIRQALANARLSAADVDAAEAHGTGTTLGDPIEARALIATYGQERSNGPLYVGSLKSNIGHTNAAAGVAGVIKMVEALRRERLPRSLHCVEPSPHVDWSAGAVELLHESVEWPAGERLRRAAVSSFGISGTNAHLILEEPPRADDAPVADGDAPALAGALPFAVSAATADALGAQAGRLASFLDVRSEAGLADVATALATRRASLSHRAVAVASDRDELVAALRSLERGELAAGTVRGVASEVGRVAFLFSGQGSQWVGMGAELRQAFPAFADALEEVCANLDGHLERPLLEVMFAEQGSAAADLLANTRYTQVALFALEVSLYRLVRSFGVEPDYLIGHSIGEFSAAHAAGVLSLSDACLLVAERARLMGALPEGGAMLAVEASEDEALESLAGFEGRLALAAVNGPQAVTVSGEEGAIGEIEALWRGHDRRTTRLDVSHAFHSQLMEPMLDELRAVAEGVELFEPSIAIVSNVTGEQLTAEQARSPDYWVRHVRETVRFADGVRHLRQAGVTRFLELGPDGVLSALAAQTVATDEEELLFTPTLRGPERPQGDALLEFLGAAHCHGVDVDWGLLFDGCAPGRVELPTYAFQGRRYWLESSVAAGSAAAGLTATEHPLLSSGQPLAGSREWLFTGRLSLATHPWLADHEVAGVVLLPGTAFVELALLAARHVGAGDLEDLTLLEPLVLDGRGAVQLQLAVKEIDEDGRRPLEIYSRPEGGSVDDPGDADWTLHATGLIEGAARSSDEDAALTDFAAASWPPADAEELDVELLYDQLADMGYEYGPTFRGLRRAFRSGDAWYAEVALADEHDHQTAGFLVHPALADAALHTMLLALLDRDEQDAPTEVPFSFSGVRLRNEGCSALRVRIALARDAEVDVTTVSLLALDEHGSPALAVETVKTRPVDPTALQAKSRDADDALFGIEWTALGAAASDGALPRAALLSSGDDGRELDFAELALERYPDLEALEELVASGAPAPDVVLAVAPTASGETAPVAHETARRTLELLQARLRSELLAETRFVLLTDGALAALPGDRPNLGQAALLGLMRSAASENPGIFAVVDLDNSEDCAATLIAALGSDEPELAIRNGRVLAPRLAPAAVEDSGVAQDVDPNGTILITGGTQGVGALVARHLAAEHDARRLLLVSRRGTDTDGVDELVDSLAQLGCEAKVAACDVADRAQIEALLAEIPQEHPLTAVIHAAGVLDDGVVTSLDDERLRMVMTPKVDGALNLHELTSDLGLSQFVLFSSVAATLGVPGQGNYAAANAFLDALAQRRHADGLPATSLAWGIWDSATGMAAGEDFDLERWEGAGITTFSEQQGMTLLDAARGVTEPLLVPVNLERRALRAQARAGTVPAILSGLFRGTGGKAPAAEGSLARRLADAPESERHPIALDLVLGHIASVLKHGPDATIDAQRAFNDLGFDSLSAIELRNRLSQATGFKLPATLIFDHATPAAVAELLCSKVADTGSSTQATRRSQSRTDEPIAIVGMSCRYPGGVRSPADLWELVLSGTDAIDEFPDDRGWDLENLFDPDPDHPGTSYTRTGGFLYDAGEFDPEFFSISPREALAIDPQHRLLLEGSWEALEDAGIDPSELRGSPTGVYAGVMHHDYGSVGMPADLEGYIGTGGSLLSGRLAYAFGFEGPAVSVDTACSSSLVALHLACQALQQGECDLALAGGATVLATPMAFVQFSRQRALAADGRCRAFGAGANGTAWSEGIGLLVLERLSDARQAGHRVLAVVPGSAVNQDGASNGLTAPNGPAQERVIRQALASAGLSPADVDAVDGHGTGTELGDPIEAQALLATYGQERSNGPLYLGSLKSNFGHTQAAAGVGSVIKMVQALRHGLLPRSLHCEEPSPHVDWSEGEVELLASPMDWSPGERPRRAGISSFGISGTNAHVILEEAPAPPAEVDLNGDGPEHPTREGALPFLVSAATEEALAAQAGRLADFLEEGPGEDPYAVACGL
ncbi:MAG TPA: SDR family NAD(P)-dependent oxidoreductase, partial [Solirubrobacterales bacterium]